MVPVGVKGSEYSSCTNRIWRSLFFFSFVRLLTLHDPSTLVFRPLRDSICIPVSVDPDCCPTSTSTHRNPTAQDDTHKRKIKERICYRIHIGCDSLYSFACWWSVRLLLTDKVFVGHQTSILLLPVSRTSPHTSSPPLWCQPSSPTPRQPVCPSGNFCEVSNIRPTRVGPLDRDYHRAWTDCK